MRIPTMMQPYASVAKLQDGGPILQFGTDAMSDIGSPPPRIIIRSPSSDSWRAGEPSRVCFGASSVMPDAR